MAAIRKYANLPDLDLAPDVYETPDLVDDISTIQATSARSPSANSEYEEAPEGIDSEETSGVVRQRLRAAEARTRFKPSRVDARNVDFSERLNGSKRYYKTSNRRRRRRSYESGEDGEFGDLSDSEDEPLDRRLARLRREIEEVKIELAEDDSTTTDPDVEEGDILENVGKLSQALDAIYTSRHGTSREAETVLARTISKFDKAELIKTTEQPRLISSKAPATSPEHQLQLAQALSKAAEFDNRLSSFEQALGLNGTTLPDHGPDAPKPILHTLDTLDRQVQTVSNSSASIDAARNKTRELLKEAERLQKLRASNAQDYDSSPPSSAGLAPNGQTSSSANYAEDTERASKINALYGQLSTIDSLAPTLPLVLDRLRTLRLLHTSAAAASTTLDEMEKRQGEQAAEIKLWREALEKVEKNLKEGEGGLMENVKTVGAWVKDLEGRMEELG